MSAFGLPFDLLDFLLRERPLLVRADVPELTWENRQVNGCFTPGSCCSPDMVVTGCY